MLPRKCVRIYRRQQGGALDLNAARIERLPAGLGLAIL